MFHSHVLNTNNSFTTYVCWQFICTYALYCSSNLIANNTYELFNPYYIRTQYPFLIPGCMPNCVSLECFLFDCIVFIQCCLCLLMYLLMFIKTLNYSFRCWLTRYTLIIIIYRCSIYIHFVVWMSEIIIIFSRPFCFTNF